MNVLRTIRNYFFYSGSEKNYSEIFKKADTALYRSKADESNRFCIYE